MDPLSALSVATKVIQFIDFSHRLLINTREIYHSTDGLTHDMVKLSTVASDLSQLSNNLRAQCNIVENAKPSKGTSEEILLRVCLECQDVSRALHEGISALHGKEQRDLAQRQENKPDTAQTSIYYYFGKEINTTLDSFAAALREVWSRKKIKAWHDQLADLRAQLTTASLDVLWYDLVSIENV